MTLSDLLLRANRLIVEWSGQVDWRGNFVVGLGAVVVVGFILAGFVVWAKR